MQYRLQNHLKRSQSENLKYSDFPSSTFQVSLKKKVVSQTLLISVITPRMLLRNFGIQKTSALCPITPPTSVRRELRFVVRCWHRLLICLIRRGTPQCYMIAAADAGEAVVAIGSGCADVAETRCAGELCWCVKWKAPCSESTIRLPLALP